MPQNSHRRKPRLLFVDDEATALTLYQDLLTGFSCELRLADSAKAAMAIAREFQPDIIISDIFMPEEDGFDLCKKIRTDPAFSGVVLILASGQADAENSLLGIEAGADDYIQKPVGRGELIAKLKAFLRIKTLQDNLSRANRELSKTLRALEKAKTELEEKNAALTEEKKMIENSLKQISLMATEREKNNNELARLNQRHQENIEGLIAILSFFIESKRQYHRGHSKKVAEISSYIAKELDLPEAEIRNIEIAALLHELGKLSIPDDLAMKNPRDYTSEEKDFLSQHPVQGASVLEQFSGFEEIAHIVRHTHERYDGTGTPNNLEGEDIPMGSRIIAIANIFENLVFRQSDIDTRKAFEILEDDLGERFDPTLGPLLHQYAQTLPLDEDVTIREIHILELEPGMELAGGIFTVGGTKLLPIGTVLTEASIKQVAHYNTLEPISSTVYIKS